MGKENIEKALQKWLSMSDMVPFDVIMATALAPLFQGDAIWLLVVGPSGSGKTELVRSLRGEYVLSFDTISSNSLISGLKVPGKDETFGLMEELDKKLLVIKDLTTMLEKVSGRPEDNVFAQLRSAYDGEYAAFHGSGHRRQAYKAQFGLIAAVTPVIDRYRAINSALGERFLTIRIDQNPNEEKEVIRKSQKNRGTEDAMRQEIGHAVTTTLNEYRDIATGVGCPFIQEPDLGKIRSLANILAHMRTEVARDHRHNIIGTPSPEVGSRLVKQLTRLGDLLNLYEAYDYKKITRVARDCINPLRLKVIRTLYHMMQANPWELYTEANVSYTLTKEICEELWMLGVCDKEDQGKSSNYSFKDKIMDMLIESEMLQ